MYRVFFLGESKFIFKGIKEILLRGFLSVDVIHVSLTDDGFLYSSISLRDSDVIIVSPDEKNLLRYSGLLRSIRQSVIIFSEKKFYNLIEIVCGRGFFFIESNSSVSVFSKRFYSFITCDNFSKTELSLPKIKITEIEFRIMVMMSMGWDLTHIASFTNRSVKTISVHKSNISKKLGFNSSQLKVFLARGFFSYSTNDGILSNIEYERAL